MATEPIPVTQDERKAAARALYETTPDIRTSEIADQVGATSLEVRRWREADKAAGDPWKLAHDWEQPGGRAAREAKQLKPAMDATHAEAESEALAVVAAAENAVKAVIPLADPTSELLTKHQREWVGPRALAYQAMKLGQTGRINEAFTLAKLAKISAESMSIIQQGELRAMGLKPGDGSKPVIVIERTGDDA